MSFIKRMKFWIALAVFALAGGVVLGLVFMPAAKKNSEKLAELELKAQGVHTQFERAQTGGVKNQKWIEQAKQQAARYGEALGQIQSTLLAQSALLREPFTESGAEPGRLPEYGVWWPIYKAKMEDLNQEITDAFPGTTFSLSTTPFSDTWAPSKVMRDEERRYWLFKYVLEALAKANEEGREVVPTFEYLSFAEGKPERLMQPSHASMFKAIPFEIGFSAEFQNVPLVLEALMSGDVSISVTSLNIDRATSRTARRQASTSRTGRAAAARSRDQGDAPQRMTARERMEMMMEGRGRDREAEREAEEPQVGSMLTAPGRSVTATSTAAAAAARGPQTVVLAGPGESAQDRQGAAQERGKTIVAVTVRGYVVDYVAPKS